MASSDIVIVSQFGAKAGGTPGNYIRRYTARLDATEELAPYTVAQNLQSYTKAYDERNERAEKVIDELATEDTLVKEDQKVTDQSARLFGNEGLVYSREQFSSAVRKTEEALEEGHTLITPVVSFSHDYLVKMGIVPEDMPKVENEQDEGAYRGQVDQLKLRRAITKGMKGMCDKSHFVEPEWTAAIQIDTANVHVHLTLIETCDMDKVPKERFVISPKKDVQIVHMENGQLRERVVPIVDDSGEPVTENLGERGKLQPRAMRSFREGVEQELIRMKGSKPFTNQLSAHSQLVKQHSAHLSLEHTALSSQLVQIYEALPKGDVHPNDTYVEQDQKIRSQQRNWRAGSNRTSMKKANRLANAYVDRLIDGHREAIGYDAYEQAVDEYTETKAPDSLMVDNTAERERLKQVVTDRLKEEMVNGLYQSLKPLRIVDNKDVFLEVQSSQMDDRERLVIEGQLTPKGLQMALLDDEQLKDLIADQLAETDVSPYGNVLHMEKRLRDYPLRHDRAKEKYDYYEQLRDGYDRLREEGHTTPESVAMRDMYSVESDYHAGVQDKYAYLMNRRQKPFLSYKGTRYPLIEDDRLSDWVQRVHPTIKRSVKNGSVTPTVEATRVDRTAPDRLPEDVVQVLEVESKGVPLKEAVKHDNPVREMVRTYDQLLQQSYTREQYMDVSKERFDEVKGYDLIETVYDIDSDASRAVSSAVTQNNRSIQELRKETFSRAFVYLEGSGQNTMEHREYAYFKHEAEGVDEALEFVSVVDRSGELPRPLRRHHQTQHDLAELEGERVLPSNEARAFNMDFLDTCAPIVKREETSIREYTNEVDVDQSFDIHQELIRLNQYHIAQLKKAEEEDEAKRRMEEEHHLLRAVPTPQPKVTAGALDKEYARELFKERERELIPRYVSSYYEMSYSDPSIDV